MVVGVAAIICPMKTERVIMRRDIWWSLGAAVAVLIMMLDLKISRIEGILLLCGMVAYISVLVVDALKKRDYGDEVKAMSPLKSTIFIIGGLAAIIIGGDLVVDSACDIAAAFGHDIHALQLTDKIPKWDRTHQISYNYCHDQFNCHTYHSSLSLLRITNLIGVPSKPKLSRSLFSK